MYIIYQIKGQKILKVYYPCVNSIMFIHVQKPQAQCMYIIMTYINYKKKNIIDKYTIFQCVNFMGFFFNIDVASSLNKVLLEFLSYLLLYNTFLIISMNKREQ